MSKYTPVTAYFCANCKMAIETIKAEWVDTTLQIMLSPCVNCCRPIPVEADKCESCAKEYTSSCPIRTGDGCIYFTLAAESLTLFDTSHEKEMK